MIMEARVDPASSAVVVCGYFFNYFAGRTFFLRLLFSDLQVRDVKAQWLFCATFALGLSLFQLIICEVLGVLSREARWAVWRFALWALSALIAGVLPFYLFFRAGRDVGCGRLAAAAAATLCFVALHLPAAWWLGDRFGVVGDREAHGVLALEQFVGRIGLFGVALLGVLSGFGVVNMPYKHWSYFRRAFGADEIAALEQQLLRTMETVLRLKKRALAEDGGRGQQRGRGAAAALAAAAAAQSTQIATLEDFGRDVFLEVVAMRNANERLRASHTAKGRCLSLIGFIGTGICAAKMTLATLNILLSRERKLDPVSRILGLVLFSMDAQRVEALAQQISFVFVAILTGFSIRGFLTTLSKLFRCCTRRVSAESVVVLLAEIMGMYFVAQTLLWRMNIAPKYRAIVTDALGDVRFGMFYTEFDSIFIVSAWATIIMLGVGEWGARMMGKGGTRGAVSPGRVKAESSLA